MKRAAAARRDIPDLGALSRAGRPLPAPKEPFYMLFRMYLPDIEILNGQYDLLGVKLATS